MKKRKVGRKLSRVRNQRRALLRTLMVSLIKHKKIRTTLAKAKELRPYAERMVTRAKRVEEGKITKTAGIRLLAKELPVTSVKELLEIAKEFASRKGGYVRILKMPPRKSDYSDMALIGWVEPIWNRDKKEKKDKGKDKEEKTKQQKKAGKEKEAKKEEETTEKAKKEEKK